MTCVYGNHLDPSQFDRTCEAGLSAIVTFAKENQGGTSASRPGKEEAMNTTLKRTLKSLLYAGAALMILIAGSANWPRH
jgi:hypothetical protein